MSEGKKLMALVALFEHTIIVDRANNLMYPSKNYEKTKAKIQKIADSLDWISVDERLPEERGHYDFYNMNSYEIAYGVLYDSGNFMIDMTIKTKWTHWRKDIPLPKPPVKEK